MIEDFDPVAASIVAVTDGTDGDRLSPLWNWAVAGVLAIVAIGGLALLAFAT